jgi:adenylosuccinate synthase
VTTQIEIYDQKRKYYRGGGLIGSIVFFIAWIGYVITRLSTQTTDYARITVLIIMVLAVIVQAYYALRVNLLERDIRKDPQMKEALNNELVQLNELKAWRASFFSVIGFIVLAAVASFFIQINDLMLIVLTALLVGFGTHNIAVYFLDK